MSPSEITKLLTIAWKHQHTVLIKGEPGVGKTCVVKAAAKQAGMLLWMAHPAISEATDYKGFPVAYTHKDTRRVVEFLPDVHLDKLRMAEGPTVAFFDDVGQAPSTVQAALMQLIQERKLNGMLISEHIVFVGATNDATHAAGVSGFLEPFKGRWSTIVEMKTALDDWVKWAYEHEMPDMVIAFVRTRPELLHAFKPTRTLERSPDPRSWEKAGRWLNLGITNPEVLAGCIGQGAALELNSFITLAKSVPDIDEIIAKPETAIIPKELNLHYLVASALARRASPANMGKIMKYLQRLSQSMRTLCLRDATSLNANIADTKPYIDWARSEGKELIY